MNYQVLELFEFLTQLEKKTDSDGISLIINPTKKMLAKEFTIQRKKSISTFNNYFWYFLTLHNIFVKKTYNVWKISPIFFNDFCKNFPDEAKSFSELIKKIKQYEKEGLI